MSFIPTDKSWTSAQTHVSNKYNLSEPTLGEKNVKFSKSQPLNIYDRFFCFYLGVIINKVMKEICPLGWSDSLCIDDLCEAVPPDTAVCQGAGLEESTLLPCPQGAYPEACLQFLHRDTQQRCTTMHKVYRMRQEDHVKKRSSNRTH